MMTTMMITMATTRWPRREARRRSIPRRRGRPPQRPSRRTKPRPSQSTKTTVERPLSTRSTKTTAESQRSARGEAPAAGGIAVQAEEEEKEAASEIGSRRTDGGGGRSGFCRRGGVAAPTGIDPRGSFRGRWSKIGGGIVRAERGEGEGATSQHWSRRRWSRRKAIWDSATWQWPNPKQWPRPNRWPRPPHPPHPPPSTKPAAKPTPAAGTVSHVAVRSSSTGKLRQIVQEDGEDVVPPGEGADYPSLAGYWTAV